MKLSKSSQNLIPTGIKTTFKIDTNLSDGTEIKATISHFSETRKDAQEWSILKRELIRTAFLNIEDVCCKRVVKHLKVTQLRKRLFSDA
jgi:hypothetical protein